MLLKAVSSAGKGAVPFGRLHVAVLETGALRLVRRQQAKPNNTMYTTN